MIDSAVLIGREQSGDSLRVDVCYYFGLWSKLKPHGG
jgi:hypothetical protein